MSKSVETQSVWVIEHTRGDGSKHYVSALGEWIFESADEAIKNCNCEFPVGEQLTLEKPTESLRTVELVPAEKSQMLSLVRELNMFASIAETLDVEFANALRHLIRSAAPLGREGEK